MTDNQARTGIEKLLQLAFSEDEKGCLHHALQAIEDRAELVKAIEEIEQKSEWAAGTMYPARRHMRGKD